MKLKTGIELKNAVGFYRRGHRARRENSLEIIPFHNHSLRDEIL
jgi:hypothetical protein